MITVAVQTKLHYRPIRSDGRGSQLILIARRSRFRVFFCFSSYFLSITLFSALIFILCAISVPRSAVDIAAVEARNEGGDGHGHGRRRGRGQGEERQTQG